MAITSEATGISEILKCATLKEGKGSLEKGELCFFTCKERTVWRKTNSSS